MISAKGFTGRTVGSGTITVGGNCLGISRSTSGIVTLGSIFGVVGVMGGGVGDIDVGDVEGEGDVGSYTMGQKATHYTGCPLTLHILLSKTKDISQLTGPGVRIHCSLSKSVHNKAAPVCPIS